MSYPDCTSCTPGVLALERDEGSWGFIRDWTESNGALEFSRNGVAWESTPTVNGRAWWSIAGVGPEGPRGTSAWYYPNDSLSPTWVVEAVGYDRVSDIVDAYALDYSSATIGPVSADGIVVFYHPDSGVFLALRAQLIEGAAIPNCPLSSTGDFAFYLQADGSGDFSIFRDVEPIP